MVPSTSPTIPRDPNYASPYLSQSQLCRAAVSRPHHGSPRSVINEMPAAGLCLNTGSMCVLPTSTCQNTRSLSCKTTKVLLKETVQLSKRVLEDFSSRLKWNFFPELNSTDRHRGSVIDRGEEHIISSQSWILPPVKWLRATSICS